MSARIVTVYSTKGGVGKTTTAVTLASIAAADGNRVLLWDLDPQAASTWLLEVKQKMRGGAGAVFAGDAPLKKAIRGTDVQGLDVVPADASYRDLDIALDAAKKSSSRLAKALKPLKSVYDVIIIDCPPGASLVAENALHVADVVVTPLSPALLSLRSYEQVTAFLAEQESRAKLIAFLNMVDRRKKTHRDAAERLPSEIRGLSDIVVPASVVVERMGERHEAVTEFAASSDPAKAFRALWHVVSRA
ncbi:ParA family protein [Microbacterium indicum]|uniref:ParA family protein n=1 Tax=Microbacterium indicum TaxID=358100 RepID=UPI00041C2DC1|nr:ParA family protein [Microbacterium indicum]